MIGCYLAPESPWYLVRVGKLDKAKKSLRRLARREGATDEDLQRNLALMIHTNEMERQVSEGTSYLDCFKRSELRRTEIVCMTWMAQVSGRQTPFFAAGMDPLTVCDRLV